MNLEGHLLSRTFGRPQGLMGRLRRLVMARINGPCGKWVLDRLEVRGGDRVLEIGIGSALLGQEATKRTPTGVMLAQASRRNVSPVTSVQVVLRPAEAADLPFQDRPFDKALAVNWMQVWPDPLAGLAEMRRVLVPGDRLALGFTPRSGQSHEGAVSAAEAAGLADVQMLERNSCFCVLAPVP